MILWLFILIYLIVCLVFCLEKRTLAKYRRSFKAIIHVSGIRGKTSTCRILDAALRTKYKVYTKTTGTDASYIDTSNIEHPVRRISPANIKEQISTIRNAWKDGAEILILECMAVRPELQRASQEQIVQSSISVITNVRYDHPFEMGLSLLDIAESLSAVIPKNGTLYTAAEDFYALYEKKCKENHARFVACTPRNGELENITLARSIAQDLGITQEDFTRSLEHVTQDFGILKLYNAKYNSGKEFSFLNLFSVNDPQSSLGHIRRFVKQGDAFCFLYNNRSDRPDRILLFSRFFFPQFSDVPVYLIGNSCLLARKLIRKYSRNPVIILKDWKELLSLSDFPLVIGLGNIKNDGCSIITYMEEHHG